MPLFQKSVLNKFIKSQDSVKIEVDKEIDKMVYELYGLTEEEIQIVENS